ncbi:MAG TPA: uroporphyrinogen-III C-methyltransferase [Burkholderiaceae bacterium]|nr:uroporphyrinogen-III C-methyltransferase [Burkholderiaceae bacterium]
MMSKFPPLPDTLDMLVRPPRAGTVYLVGAGPGDPDLLTLRAARLLGQADCVVYDHLVGSGVMALVRGDAERIYVGKEERNHTLSQDGINALLVRLARQGRQVVRLKGGDPFIFGRGGEELEVLAAAGIRYEVVPGVTAASGVSCYTGIPLTHRDYAQSCIFTTGHLQDGTLNLDWETLAQPRQTVVIYMGLKALPEISRQLIAHGQPPDMPAAVVEQGTTPRQRVVRGTLANISRLVSERGFKSPCLILVGEVAALHDRLSWFGNAQEAALEDEVLA